MTWAAELLDGCAQSASWIANDDYLKMRSKEDEGEKWKRFELKDLDKGDKYRYWHGIVGKYLGFNFSILTKMKNAKTFFI